MINVSGFRSLSSTISSCQSIRVRLKRTTPKSRLLSTQPPTIDSIFFAPPISQSIVSILSSPYDQNRYFMHFESDEFCQWKIHNGKTLIESIHSFKDLINTQGYPASEQVSIVKLLPIIPPFYDVETKMWETDLIKAKHLFGLEQHDITTLANIRDEVLYRQLWMKLKFLVLVCC